LFQRNFVKTKEKQAPPRRGREREREREMGEIDSTKVDQITRTQGEEPTTSSLEEVPAVAQGKPVSGRTWKKSTKRASSVINVKPLRSSWKKKVSEKERLKQVKLHENILKEAARQQKEVCS